MSIVTKKIVTNIKPWGKAPGMRSFLCTVIEEYAIRTEYLSTDIIWARYILGRDQPRIRPFKAKTNAGLEFTIGDAVLLNAVEEEAMNWLRTNDKKFYEDFVSR